MGSTTITRNNPHGVTLYFTIQKATEDGAWNGSSFEVWADGNIGTYDVPMPQISGPVYGADFPSGLTPINAWYLVTIREQDGAAPAVNDTIVETRELYWTGVSLDESVSADTTNEGILRLLCNDPDDGDTLLSTANYTSILSVEADNIYKAAVLACDAIAALFAQKVDSANDSGRYALSQKFTHYTELAGEYRKRAASNVTGLGGGLKPRLTGISKSEMESQREDTDRVDSAFPLGFDSFTQIDPEASYERDTV